MRVPRMPSFHEDRSSQRERDENAAVGSVDVTEGDGLQGGDHVVEDEDCGPDDRPRERLVLAEPARIR